MHSFIKDDISLVPVNVSIIANIYLLMYSALYMFVCVCQIQISSTAISLDQYLMGSNSTNKLNPD